MVAKWWAVAIEKSVGREIGIIPKGEIKPSLKPPRKCKLLLHRHVRSEDICGAEGLDSVK